jgi:hypothetical protein
MEEASLVVGGGGGQQGPAQEDVKKDANLQGIVGDYNSFNKADYLRRIKGILYKEFQVSFH